MLQFCLENLPSLGTRIQWPNDVVVVVGFFFFPV